MPITRKQFELGIDAQIEAWMAKIHFFLADHKDEAFAGFELAEQLDGFSQEYKAFRLKGVSIGPMFDSVFELALEKLLETGAVDTRLIRGESYYHVGPNPLEI